jgi:hypothetical protein
VIRRFREEQKHIKMNNSHQLAEKAKEIDALLRKITELIPEEDEHLQFIKQDLHSNSMLIQAKIAGAEGVNIYDIKMENATLIRKAARELMVSYHSLEMFGFSEVEYYKLIVELIEEFRLLFIEWVASFDQKKFIVDRWGLFNPPGISPDYEQSEDELDALDEDE